jgi:hypothetical protein
MVVEESKGDVDQLVVVVEQAAAMGQEPAAEGISDVTVEVQEVVAQ